MNEIPQFKLSDSDHLPLCIKWADRDFPEDVTEYLLDKISIVASLQECNLKINDLLTDLCDRGLLWRLRDRWVCQPYIWDELGEVDDGICFFFDC